MNTVTASSVTWSMTGGSPKVAECRGCSKPFPVSHGLQRYCSVECRTANKADDYFRHQCKACGCAYWCAKKKSSYCSQACKRAGSKVCQDRDCVQCGQRFTAPNNRKKTCSERCRRLAQQHRRERDIGNFSGQAAKLDCLPSDPARPSSAAAVAQWLNRIDFDDLQRAWVPAIVAHFAEGDRARLSECLRVVRDRNRDEIRRLRAKCGIEELAIAD